ncbi:MAG: hypothetical protein ACJA00_005650 [Myxococcota bacterium]|jgi:hypothetical protein
MNGSQVDRLPLGKFLCFDAPAGIVEVTVAVHGVDQAVVTRRASVTEDGQTNLLASMPRETLVLDDVEPDRAARFQRRLRRVAVD